MPRPTGYLLTGSYGDFNETKVYYFGFEKRPGFLPVSGRGFAGLKHLLELLRTKFKRFTLTFTPAETSVKKNGKVFQVRIAAPAIRQFGQRRWDANRQLNLRLGNQMLAELFPDHFVGGAEFHSYQKGLFAAILKPSFDPRLLSPEDRTALTKFVTGDVAKGHKGIMDIPSAYETARDVQLLYLRNLVSDFDVRLAEHHEESWWQSYFSNNILFFQTNYIQRIEKTNVTVIGTQFPDFAVITSDGYLDLIEIKKPDTELLKEDTSRHNFYWSTEISKAVSQVENYLDNVTRNGPSLLLELKNRLGIDLQIIKPRGLVIAGCRTTEFGDNKKRADDFRRLNHGLKNVQIIPYDELSQHIRNTIHAIELLAATQKTSASKTPGRTKATKNHKT